MPHIDVTISRKQPTSHAKEFTFGVDRTQDDAVVFYMNSKKNGQEDPVITCTGCDCGDHTDYTFVIGDRKTSIDELKDNLELAEYFEPLHLFGDDADLTIEQQMQWFFALVNVSPYVEDFKAKHIRKGAASDIAPIVSAISTKEIESIRLHATPDNPIVIVPHDNPDVDAIVSATMLHNLLELRGIPSFVCLRTSPDTQTIRLLAENNLYCPDNAFLIREIPDDAPLVLVDWFAVQEPSVDNHIVAVFDHHPTFQEIEGDIVYEKAYSSTAKLVYDLFAADDDTIGENLRRELVCNVLYTTFIDTNSMKSTKYNEADTPWIEENIEKYGLDRQHLVQVGYCLDDLSRPGTKLVRNGEKQYVLPNGKKARMAYIIVDGYNGSRNQEFAFLTMRTLMDGFDYAWFMICDLGMDKTHVFKSRLEVEHGEGDIYGEWVTYDANLSRSKDIYPMLEAENQA